MRLSGLSSTTSIRLGMIAGCVLRFFWASAMQNPDNYSTSGSEQLWRQQPNQLASWWMLINEINAGKSSLFHYERTTADNLPGNLAEARFVADDNEIVR